MCVCVFVPKCEPMLNTIEQETGMMNSSVASVVSSGILLRALECHREVALTVQAGHCHGAARSAQLCDPCQPKNYVLPTPCYS